MVPCEYKCPHELKYLAMQTDFDRSAGTYALEFTVLKSIFLFNWKDRKIINTFLACNFAA